MEKISSVTITKNEVVNIKGLIESLKDCDEIIIADDGSTDGTVELATAMGAKVFQRQKHEEIATQEDVDAFVKRFGWEPRFKDGSVIWNSHLWYMEAISHASNEWIVMPDADERISWDFDEVQKLLPRADQIISEFVHSHDENGNPHNVRTITKMFRKSLARVEGRTHCVLMPAGVAVSTNKMRIDHWQIPREKRQSFVLPIMEYSVLKENDSRSRFYLAREYYYYHEYEKSLKLFDEYLADSVWWLEIDMAYLYMARCYWESGQGDKAREYCMKSILQNPDHKETLYLMSEMFYEPWKSKWKYIADNATDKDVLF